MNEDDEHTINPSRRRFLIASTSVIGAVAVAVTAAPFIASMEPSAAAQAAGEPVNVDISKLEPGQLITVQWRSRPIWILRRSQQQQAILPTLDGRLKDPHSQQRQQLANSQNEMRAIKPEYFVAVAICTHLGCVPTYRPRIAPSDLGADWKGGFYCPCHGSRYDLAGRVFNNSPAPLNLPVPPYYYLSEHTLRIGELENGADKNWTPISW